jgi:hypothetical protein
MMKGIALQSAALSRDSVSSFASSASTDLMELRAKDCWLFDVHQNGSIALGAA